MQKDFEKLQLSISKRDDLTPDQKKEWLDHLKQMENEDPDFFERAYKDYLLELKKKENKMNYIIIDWTNRILFNGIEFETQDEAWDLIYNSYHEDESDIDDRT